MRPELTIDDVLKAKDLGKDLTIEDWPFGRKQRCTMHFFVESNKKGERLIRQSTMNGRTYKPKRSTYATGIKIVELNGRTCYVVWHDGWRHFGVSDHAGMHIQTFFDEEAEQLAQHFGLL